jgi:hypothetical protein
MIKPLLQFRNADSTQDLNNQLAGFFSTGIIAGGAVVPVVGALQVQVTPFKLIGPDGMVVMETSNTATLNVVAGETNVVVFQTIYSPNSTPTTQFLVMSLAVYEATPSLQKAQYVVFAYVSPLISDIQVSPSEIDYTNRDELDPLQRLILRGTLTDPSLLPPTQNRPGDAYLITSGLGDNPALDVWNGVGWINITDSLTVASLLSAHRNNLFANEIHLTNDQAAAALGTYDSPSSGNPYVTSEDPRVPTTAEAEALLGVPTGNPVIPPGPTVLYLTGAFPIAQPVAIAVSAAPGPSIPVSPGDGPVFVGTGGAGTALQYFKIYHATLQREYLNSASVAVQITGIFKDSALTQPLVPSSESGVLADNGFYTGSVYLTYSAVLDLASRLIYGQKQRLDAISKGFLLLPTPTSAETTQETLQRMQAISGLPMDTPVPIDTTNVALRTDVNFLEDYVNATTASDLVLNAQEFPRLRETPKFAPLFPLNTGVQIYVASGAFAVATTLAAVQAFDSYYNTHTPDLAAIAIIQYSTVQVLTSVQPGSIFTDGAGVNYRVLAVNSTGNGSVMLYTKGLLVSAAVGATSGQIVQGNNPRQVEVLADQATSCFREIIPIEDIVAEIGTFEGLPPGGSSVGTGSLFSLIGTPLLPNQGNSAGAPSGRPVYQVLPKKEGNHFDPRVILIGDWESDQAAYPNQAVGQVSQGTLGIEYTGRVTDLILFTAVKPSMAYGFRVFVDGVYNSSHFLASPNDGVGFPPSNMIQALRGYTESQLQPLLFSLGLSGTQVHTVRIEVTVNGTDIFPLFGLEVYFAGGFNEEAGSAFTQAQLVQTTGPNLNATPVTANTYRGVRTTRYVNRSTGLVTSALNSPTTIYNTAPSVIATHTSFSDSVLAAAAQIGDVFLFTTKNGVTPLYSDPAYDTNQEIYSRVLSVDRLSPYTITVDDAIPFTLGGGGAGRIEFVFSVPSRVSDGAPILSAPNSTEAFEYARFQVSDWDVGSPNDISGLSKDTADSRVTVLNDAMTSLLASQCQRVSTGLSGFTSGIQLNTTGSFVTVTAWGTRQDFIFCGTQGPCTVEIEVDGKYTYEVSLLGEGMERHTAFYKGAPQSHTVRILNPSVANCVVIGAVCLHDLAPAQINGTVLSDYTIVRNSIVTASAPGEMDFAYTALNNPCVVSNAGVRVVDITKGHARYYTGSGGTTQWRVLQDFVNNPRFGYYVETDETNAEVELFFIGTHIEIYYDADVNKGWANVLVDDLAATNSNFGSLIGFGGMYVNPLNPAPSPGLSVGQIDMYAASQTKKRMILTGLPFGRHKLTIQVAGVKNASSSGFFVRLFAFAENAGLGAIQNRSPDDLYSNHLHFSSFRDMREFVTLLPEQVGIVSGSGGGGSSTPGLTSLEQVQTALVDLATEPYWFGVYNDWSDDADSPALPSSPAYSAAGYTNPATYRGTPAGLQLNYDCNESYSVTGTAVLLTGAVSWAVVPADLVGCMFQPTGPSNVGALCRITAASSLTQFTIDTSLTTVPSGSPESCGVKQTMHTKDLVQFKPGTAGDDQAISDRLPYPLPSALTGLIVTDVQTVKFEAEASIAAGAAGEDPLWNGTSLVAYQLNRSGLRTVGSTPPTADSAFWSTAYQTNGYEEQDTPVVTPPGNTVNQRLFLRVFPATLTGAGSINLLRWSALFFDTITQTPNAVQPFYARAYTDGSIVATNCTLSLNGSSHTRITFPQPYQMNAFPNVPLSGVVVKIGGIDFVKAGVAGYNYASDEGTFTEVNPFTIDLDANYTGVHESIDIYSRGGNLSNPLLVSALAPYTWELSGSLTVPGKPSDGIRSAFSQRNFTQLKVTAYNSGASGTTTVQILQNGTPVATANLPAANNQVPVYVSVSIFAQTGDQFQMQVTAAAVSAQDLSVELA